MTDTTATPPNGNQGPWAIPVRQPQPPAAEARPRTSFPRKVWHLLVAIKDALALLFLLLFFVALFGLLAGRPSASLPVSDGALLLKLDGVVSEQPPEVDTLSALSGGQDLREYRVRDISRRIGRPAGRERGSQQM